MTTATSIPAGSAAATSPDRLYACLEESPVIAILRGIEPVAVGDVAEALLAHGIRVIEIPLNSPAPLDSIQQLRTRMKGRGLCGAGTVLHADQVRDVAAAGGELIVSPNADLDVIGQTVDLGLASVPGCMTPTEAFAAVNAGAHALKIFPASTLGPGYFSALKAVIPGNIGLVATGGVSAANIAEYRAAGAMAFGIGSDIYKPGYTPDTVSRKAAALLGSM